MFACTWVHVYMFVLYTIMKGPYTLFFMEIAQAGIYENTCTGKTTSLMTPTHSNDKI